MDDNSSNIAGFLPMRSSSSMESVEQNMSQSAGDFHAIDRRDNVHGDSLSENPIFFAHPINLTFYNLRASSEARVTLNREKKARWGSGNPLSKLVGMSLYASPNGTTLCLSTFMINHLEIYLATSQSCPELHLRLFLHTAEPAFGGRVDLPPSGSLTIESLIDRTSMIERGPSSFMLALR